ncbi:MAG: hypothetical protein QM692_09935 [Thermomicrobiales bacterium]
MGTSFGNVRNWTARGVVVGLLALGLTGCGDMPDEGKVVNPTTEAPAGSGETTDTTHQATAKIVNGKLDPATFGDKIGSAFELTVTGDGKEHTLAIAELVDGETIAAEGTTTVGFTIEGEPGSLEITLDGQPAGTFEKQP